MKHRKLLSLIRHSINMVQRNLKRYALLSVTIIMSFSLLLGYLLYTDSSLYNQYKELFRRRRGDILVADYSENEERLRMFLDQASEIEDTIFYVSYYGNFGEYKAQYIFRDFEMKENGTIPLANLNALFLPNGAWVDSFAKFFGVSTDIIWLDGLTHDTISIEKDQVVLSDRVYFALELDKQESPIFHLKTHGGVNLELRIVGYYISQQNSQLMSIQEWTYTPTMLLSTQLIAAADLTSEVMFLGSDDGIISGRYITIHTAYPEKVVKLAETMRFDGIDSIYSRQNAALEKIRSEKSNKAIIACALLLLLGINLYSSFTNALNDRKFEIGVKRAIGASAWSIVRQFLYESLLVMAANVFLSVALVADVFIIYKYLYELYPNAWGYYQTWVIYISPHSVAMFGICAVTLTLVFSLIFAYKSTRVEIVQYLKAE